MISLTGINSIVICLVLALSLSVAVPQAESPRLCADVSQYVEAPKVVSLGMFTATAYCSCEICCGKWAQQRADTVIGSDGTELVQGTSVASALPAGTTIIFEGRALVVQDRPAQWIVDKYGGRIIDVYFERHEDALAYGKRSVEVFVSYAE